ncbi:low molecular weight protein-tyrosine-phosphatase [Crenobacter caeni]|uniref:protein-tyrosine-phosphatase n=1 Tax=Crenobacter caeni TaxID=2705474 RepID=A0A6B2KNX6_9NEIS|nr:low molecular weight protein-tyrosine-phosphatase [Crenobacter caeni]NDV11874.1 low molecular weight phosphotyrosine protein phosphatase [Crenobacter caeni]
MTDYAILFVCMGNICRSPTFEAVLRARLSEAGLAGRVTVDSAGTHGYHAGERPDRRSQQAAARRGYDLSGQRARQVVVADFSRFDLILAADAANLAALARLRPARARARVELALSVIEPGMEVPDPYYGGGEGFDAVLDLAEAAAERWVARLAAEGVLA